ncbi:unnamed protein product [Closterium sp. Naga37s-1]|nr:unnamed protein product [Closterium sp. Naga37s-1]
MDAARRDRVRLAPPGRSQRGEGGGAKPGRESAREREARRQQLQRSLDEAQKPLAAALAVAWKGAAPPRFLFPFHFTLASQRLSPAVASSERGKDGERELGGAWGAGDVWQWASQDPALHNQLLRGVQRLLDFVAANEMPLWSDVACRRTVKVRGGSECRGRCAWLLYVHISLCLTAPFHTSPLMLLSSPRSSRSPLPPPPLPPLPPQALYEACGAALLHLLAFHAPPALQSVRQAAVRVCARMATAGGRWWRESVTGAMLLALSAYVDASVRGGSGGGRVSRAPCCSRSQATMMRQVSGVGRLGRVGRAPGPLSPCSHPDFPVPLPTPCVARLPRPLLTLLNSIQHALHPDDHVVLDACTALTASLLALPPQPPSRPLRHAPIPTLPSSLLAPPPTMLPPSPPSSSPLALPLATLTPPLLASLWRLHLSPSSAAPSTNGGEGTKGGKARGGGEGRRGGVVARAAEWLWGAAGTGDGRGVGGEAVVGPEGREGGMGGAGLHAHTATASSGGDACGGVVGTDGGSQAHSSTCSSSTPTDSSRLSDSSSSGREKKKSSDDEPMAAWKKRQAAAVAAVLHVLLLLLQRCPAGGREVKREVLRLPAHLSGGRGRMAQLVGMALPHGAHIDGSAAAVSEAVLSLLSAMAALSLLQALASRPSFAAATRCTSPATTTAASPLTPLLTFALQAAHTPLPLTRCHCPHPPSLRLISSSSSPASSARDDSVASHVAASAWQTAASLLRWPGGHHDPAVLWAAGLYASVLTRALLGGGLNEHSGRAEGSCEEQMGIRGGDGRAGGGEEQVGGSQVVMAAAWEAVRWMAAFCHVAVCDSEGGVTLVRAKEAGGRACGKAGESGESRGGVGGGGGKGEGGGRSGGDADEHAGMKAVAALACCGLSVTLHSTVVSIPLIRIPHSVLLALIFNYPSLPLPPTHRFCSAHLVALLAPSSHTTPRLLAVPSAPSPAPTTPLHPPTAHALLTALLALLSSPCPALASLSRAALSQALTAASCEARPTGEGGREGAAAVRQAALACRLCSRPAPLHSSAPLLTAETPRQEVEASTKLLVMAALACDGRGGEAVLAQGGVRAVGLVVAARVALWTKGGAGEGEGQGEGDSGEVGGLVDDGRKGEGGRRWGEGEGWAGGAREEGYGEDEWGWDEGNEAWWGDGELEGGEDEMVGVMGGGGGSDANGEMGADTMLLAHERPDIPHAPYSADVTAWQGADVILFSGLTALLALLHRAQPLPSHPTAVPLEPLALTPLCELLPENLVPALTRLLHPASPAGLRCLAARCLSLCRSLPRLPPPSAALPAAAKQPSEQQPSHLPPSHHAPATHSEPPPLGVSSAVARDIRSALTCLSPSSSSASSPIHASHSHFTPLSTSPASPKAQVAFVLTHPSAPTSTAAASPLRVAAHAAIIAARCPALLSPLTAPSAPAQASTTGHPHSTPSIQGKDEGVNGQGMAATGGERAEGGEGVVREVRLGRGVSAETFSQLLEYIYTGQVSLSHSLSKDLLQLAKKCQLEGLVALLRCDWPIWGRDDALGCDLTPALGPAGLPWSDIVLCVPCARHAPLSPAHQPPASPSSCGEEAQHEACGGPGGEGSGEWGGGQGGVWRCVRVAAHRCVLGARSQYLHALLHCGMRESSQHEVHLPPLPLPALIALLRFLYSARVSFLPLPLPPRAALAPTNLNHPSAPAAAAASPSRHHSAPAPLSSVRLPPLTLTTRLLSAVQLASLAHQWMLPALHHSALCYVAARLRATWHVPVSGGPCESAVDCSDSSSRSSTGSAANSGTDRAREGPVAPWAAAEAVVRAAWAAGHWEMVGEAVSSLAPWYPAMRRTACLHRLPPQVQSAVREAHVRLLTAPP